MNFDEQGVNPELTGAPGFNMGKFADPFLLPSSQSMPLSMNTAMDFCLFLYYLDSNFRQASKRVVSIFNNSLKFDGDKGDEEERKEFSEWLDDDLDLPLARLEMGEEAACYGNSFWRLHQPFDRLLMDYREGGFAAHPISKFPLELVTYNWNKLTYTVPDPREMARGVSAAQAKKVDFTFVDRKSTDRSRIKLRKIDPRRVILWHSWISGRQQVIYRFEEQFVNLIKQSKLYQVNETPIKMLECIAHNQDFLFGEDEVFHFKAPTISGISYHGWGLPETMANYRSLHQLLVYRRIDEAVGLDYIMPWRILTPDFGDKMGELGSITDLALMKAELGNMISKQRKDPFHVHALPFPIKYQEANGQGKELVPKDLIEFQVNSLLDSMGYPAELFRGTLALQNTPTALRLLQNNFRFIYSGFNKFSKWTVRAVLDYLKQSQMTVRLNLPTIADDLEAKQVYLQMMSANELSRATALAPWNITDPVGEIVAKAKEDMEVEAKTQKVQLEMQKQMESGSMDDVAAEQQQEGGSFPGDNGAAGGPPAGQGGLTPMDAHQKAVDLANQWAAIPDNGQRAKAMKAAEATDFNTFSIAKQLWEQMKNEGASQGRKAVTSGQMGQQPPQ